MTWLNSTYTINNARQMGRAFYELSLSNWGNANGATQDTNSLIYPSITIPQPALASVYGVSIAPDSLWDRCIVNYAVSQSGAAGKDQPTVQRLAMLVSVNSPAIFPLPGNLTVTPFISHAGATTEFDNAYYIENNTLITSFPANDFAVMRAQAYLAVNLYLQPPGLAVTSRTPYTFAQANNAQDGDGNEHVAFGPLCIAGRRHIRGVVRPFLGTWSFRIGLMQSQMLSILETTDQTIGGIDAAAGNVCKFTVDNKMADWMTIYATRTGGGGNASVWGQVMAED